MVLGINVRCNVIDGKKKVIDSYKGHLNPCFVLLIQLCH